MPVLCASAITGFHDRFLDGREIQDRPDDASGAWCWIEENHRCNAALWKEEDRARRTDVPAGDIVRCKRNIDRFNQHRNDAVEAIDQCVLAAIDPLDAPGVRLSSETVGAIIDRLSILALKIHHMRLQTLRTDAAEAHVAACARKLAVLIEQRGDLAGCLEGLLSELRDGRARFKSYRQFKMYNDPNLNPELYGRRQEGDQDVARDEDVEIDVLVPTCDHPAALAVTLTALFAQTHRRLRLVISDQGEARPAGSSGELAAVLRQLTASGREVELHRHLPRRGMAEQRHFLLEQARSPYALFIDDDVVIEPDLVARLLRALREQACGFVGSALIGLSHSKDERAGQHDIEFWDGPVQPEEVRPASPAWQRHHLHSAANIFHLQKRLGLRSDMQRLYRVAWVGGCALFDTAKLRAVGGFDFWRDLPPEHCGEDVFAQLRVMARYGGCGVIPSGAYHQELPTVERRGVDAPHVLSMSES